MTTATQHPILPYTRRAPHRATERPQTLHRFTAAFLYLFFAVFLLWPIFQIVKTGFTRPSGAFTLDYFILIFKDTTLVHGLRNGAIVAILVTLLTLVLSLPLALLSVRHTFPLSKLLNGLLLVPLVLPPFVGAIGMQIVLGRYGPLTQVLGGGGPLGIDWIGNFRMIGVIIIEALHLYPIMLLNLQASLANVDPAMEQAAANLGASRWKIFTRITLPMIQPGLFAGCTLVMIWSFTDLGTPLMFGYYTITPVQIFEQIPELSANPVPYALVVVLLLGVHCTLSGRQSNPRPRLRRLHHQGLHCFCHNSASRPQRRNGRSNVPDCFRPGCNPASLRYSHQQSVATGRAWYKSILPAHFTLDHYRQALADPLALPSVKHSLQYATCATIIALIVGFSAALTIVRSTIRGRWLIDALCMLPLAVPGLVLSFGYLSISIWLKKKLGSSTPFYLDVQEWPAFILVISYAARRLPYVVRAAVAGLQQTPRDLELAAANLGASRVTVLRRITLPLVVANLIAGGLLAFAFAVLEVSDSLILAQRMQYYPITRAILDLSMRLGDGLYIASALGVWAMLLLTLTILAANALLGKKIGAVFRV